MSSEELDFKLDNSHYRNDRYRNKLFTPCNKIFLEPR